MDATTRPGRLRSLDGLRGAAAVVVLLYHSTLVMPALVDRIWPPADASPFALPLRLATFLPHLPLLGTESVMLFFVLSGFVLVRPALDRPAAYGWLAYYPRRIVRLLLPVAAAIGLAVVLLLLVPRHPAPEISDWLTQTNSMSFTLPDLVQTIDLLGPLQPLDNPLWSLGWEVAFSLLLPIAVVLAAASARRPWLLVLGALALVTTGRLLGDDGLGYLPMFLVGGAVAVAFPRWSAWIRERVATTGGRIAAVAGVLLALLLISVPWIVRADGHRWFDLTAAVTVLGCLLLVVLCATLRPLVTLFELPPLQWLGRISYSLYLVHVPVIVTIAYLVGPANRLGVLLLGIPASILTAWGFSLAVERPSHRLSQRVGRAVERRFPNAERASRTAG